MSKALDIARDLVRCPSVTPADAGALGVLEKLLKNAGFETHRLTFSEPGADDTDNLYARIGTGAPHLTFAGHTDVVPPGDDVAWSHGAFAGDVKDGVFYGRGAVDMKGAIACCVAATLDYLATHGGTVKLLQWATARGEKFDHCLLGEPSNVNTIGDCIKVGRRGSLSGTLIVEGKQGHVAYPDRAHNPIPDLAALVAALGAEPLDRGTDHFPPSNLEFLSVDVGNPAWNVIPAQARARFNMRYNDCHTQPSLRALIEERVATACGNRIKAHVTWEPSNADAFLTQPGAFTDLVIAAIEEVTGRMPKLNTGGGTSDARFITHYCPVLEFGLVGQTMHQIDERTPVADIDALTTIYRGVLDRYFA